MTETPPGPITPVRCTVPRCPWAVHGIPDRHVGPRNDFLRRHLAEEHKPSMAKATDTPPPLTDQQLKPHLEADIRHRHNHATPGHWLRNGKAPRGGELIVSLPRGMDPVGIFDAGNGQQAEANMRFVVHAHRDIGLLLAEVDRLRAERDQARAGAFAAAIDRFRSLADLAPDSERAPGLNFAVGALMAMRDRVARTTEES